MRHNSWCDSIGWMELNRILLVIKVSQIPIYGTGMNGWLTNPNFVTLLYNICRREPRALTHLNSSIVSTSPWGPIFLIKL